MGEKEMNTSLPKRGGERGRGLVRRLYGFGRCAGPAPDPASAEALEKPSERLKKLREVVDRGGTMANANFLAYLAILIYFFVAVTSTTHEDLLREAPKAVPLLNIQLPLWWFFLVGPLALALVHLNLLNQYFYLTQNVLRYDAFIAKLRRDRASDDGHAAEERDLPLNFALSNLILDEDMPWPLRQSMRVLLWIFVVAAPLALFLLFQAYFLPYHDIRVIWIQRAVLVADVLMLLLLWQVIARAMGARGVCKYCGTRDSESGHLGGGSGTSVGKAASPTERTENASKDEDKEARADHSRAAESEGKARLCDYCGQPLVPDRLMTHVSTDPRRVFRRSWVSVLGAVLVVAFSLFSLTMPDEMQGQWRNWALAKLDHNLKWAKPTEFDDMRSAGLLKWLDKPCKRNLDLPSKLLLKADAPPELLAKFAGSAKDLPEALYAVVKENKLGLDLQRRDLRWADLRGVTFHNARLDYVQLQGARLSKTGLQGATLIGAKLQGATLIGAKLQGARLVGARLGGADLSQAQLQDANFFGTWLQGADLSQAQLQSANLVGVRLQGADLREAQLQGADLFGAGLQGADLRKAQLQGADLRNAGLQGADLREAQLQGAFLFGAGLQGAALVEAQFRGADLTNSIFEGMYAIGADFTDTLFKPRILLNSDLREASFGRSSDSDWKLFVEKLVSEVPEKQRGEVNKRLNAVRKTAHEPTAPVNSCHGPKSPDSWEYLECDQNMLDHLACSRGETLHQSAWTHSAAAKRIADRLENESNSERISRSKHMIAAFLHGKPSVEELVAPDVWAKLEARIREQKPHADKPARGEASPGPGN